VVILSYIEIKINIYSKKIKKIKKGVAFLKKV